MTGRNRVTGCSGWIDLEFIQRKRTPKQSVELGIQLQLTVLTLSDTYEYLEISVEWSRTAIHRWMKKGDRQPEPAAIPNHSVVNETVIRVNGHQGWLYAAVDPHSSEFLHE